MKTINKKGFLMGKLTIIEKLKRSIKCLFRSVMNKNLF